MPDATPSEPPAPAEPPSSFPAESEAPPGPASPTIPDGFGLAVPTDGTPPPHDRAHGTPHGLNYRLFLALAALGVVYGDIGTSPLYALKECFHGPHGIAPAPGNVLGVLSLMIWALLFVISFKYLLFVLRADNNGEGGILALMTLASRGRPAKAFPPRGVLVAMGLFGAALLYGDGILTPAITTVSAMEGLRVATPVFEPYVLPLTLVVLVGLFALQAKGTATVGKVFGPLMIVWFTVLGVLGVLGISSNPDILGAINPAHGARFFADNGWEGLLVLGAVFLVVTGGEALYADLGHFGAGPIRLAWFTVVLPGLVLNYLGQGALLLQNPEAAENPFYFLAPDWALLPLVGLATLAAAVASQAVISGVYSLTMQAVQLGYIPRVRVRHTSRVEYGQVYVPMINWALLLACVATVAGFGSSSALAAAYGVGVTTDMAIATLLLFVVMRTRWGWPLAVALPLIALFFTVDLAFWGANIVKVPNGGWFPLVIAAGVFMVMTTWRKGRELLRVRLEEGTLPIELALPDLRKNARRVPGTAVYLHGNPDRIPPALLHNLKHNKVLHDRVIFLRVESQAVPHVPQENCVTAEQLEEGFHRVTLRYGFAETPNVPAALASIELPGGPLHPLQTTYVLGRERILATRGLPGMALWREKVFAALANNATGAADYFQLPPPQVVEIGARVEM
ncbi:MAG TPA: potassium transporter Kup [Rubricoccaceae bacterium]|nr:potassium transporter Kup [Rubricoccaceae bacterium]